MTTREETAPPPPNMGDCASGAPGATRDAGASLPEPAAQSRPSVTPPVADEQQPADFDDFYDDDDDEPEDEWDGWIDDCALMPDGTCLKAGSEECDWDCPFRK